MARSRPRTRRRVFALSLVAALAAALVLASAASADFFTPQSGGSKNAADIDTLYKIVFAIAAVVFIGVEGMLVYSLVRFRARRDAVAAQIRGNTRLEVGWTFGAAAILVVLAVVTFVMLGPIRNPENSDADGFPTPVVQRVQDAAAYQPLAPNGHALNITVNGQQYVWRFTYPDADDNQLNNVFSYEEMVVPTKTAITLTIEAQDVAHSWWIPQLGGKFDAVPGHKNFMAFKVTRPGVYTGQCAELCGRNHANMVARVRAVEPAAFKQWLADKKAQIEQADAAAQVRRAQIDKQQTQGAQAP